MGNMDNMEDKKTPKTLDDVKPSDYTNGPASIKVYDAVTLGGVEKEKDDYDAKQKLEKLLDGSLTAGQYDDSAWGCNCECEKVKIRTTSSSPSPFGSKHGCYGEIHTCLCERVECGRHSYCRCEKDCSCDNDWR